MSALNLRPLDRKILSFLRGRPGEKYSAMELQSKMSQSEYGENRGISEIRNALEDMIEKMYLERHDDSPITYTASTFGKTIDVANQAKLDWEAVVETTKDKAREVLEPEDAERYISEHCEGDGLIVTHPVSGETLNILEDTEFEEKLDEAQDAIDEEMKGSLWSGPSAESKSSEPVASDGGESAGTL